MASQTAARLEAFLGSPVATRCAEPDLVSFLAPGRRE